MPFSSMKPRKTLFSVILPLAGLPLAVLLFSVAGSCNGNGGEQPQTSAERGGQYFAMLCSACHNVNDPTKDGTLGPPVAGSSFELLEAKVLRNEYPPGYTPKRNTKQMVPLPLSAAPLQDLHAFLQQVGPKGG